MRRSASAMMGKLRLVEEMSLMSFVQAACEERSLAERPMSLTLREVNSECSFAKAPSSVVQTGVKSAGWDWKIVVSHARLVLGYLKTYEENGPGVTNPFVKIEVAVGCLSFEVWRGRA